MPNFKHSIYNYIINVCCQKKEKKEKKKEVAVLLGCVTLRLHYSVFEHCKPEIHLYWKQIHARM